MRVARIAGDNELSGAVQHIEKRDRVERLEAIVDYYAIATRRDYILVEP